MKKSKLLAEQIVWDRVDEPEFPFAARYDGRNMQIRINDFPSEHLYTLVAEDSDVVSFDDWPKTWTRKSKAAKFKVAGSSSSVSPSRSFSKSASPKRSGASRPVAKSSGSIKASSKKPR